MQTCLCHLSVVESDAVALFLHHTSLRDSMHILYAHVYIYLHMCTAAIFCIPKEWAEPASLFISGGKAVIGKFPIANKVMETKLLWLVRACLASLFVVGLKFLVRTACRWSVSSPFFVFALRLKDNISCCKTTLVRCTHCGTVHSKSKCANLRSVWIVNTQDHIEERQSTRIVIDMLNMSGKTQDFSTHSFTLLSGAGD